MNVKWFGNCVLIVCLLAVGAARAAELSPQEQAMQALAERIVNSVAPDKILKLKPQDVIPLLTAQERDALSSGNVKFRLATPAIVSVIRPAAAKEEPFWLDARGFKPTGLKVKVDEKTYEVFERKFDAGEVSLGIGSFSPNIYPYFVVVRPEKPGEKVDISKLSPRQLKLEALKADSHPFVDRELHITDLPKELEGALLIRTHRSQMREAGLLHRFLKTKYPASDKPDHLVLTWSDDPRTTMTIQWRTNKSASHMKVRYRETSEGESAKGKVATAQTKPLSTPNVINDPFIHLHAVTLRDLKPGTAYQYSIGDSAGDTWSAWTDFTTAPDKPTNFSFTYMGDAQEGLDDWGGLLGSAMKKFPVSAFYILAGDLVNRGHDRDDWDSFFHNARNVFDRRVFVPVLGNHEVLHGKPPTLYLSFFQLPNNGPTSIEPGRAYAFEYSNAMFIVLDSNLDPQLQAPWLDEQLGKTRAKWKFVSFHHPVYASHPDRNHEHLLRAWAPVFDKHRVDMVLQGHDHAYLRTHQMYENKRSIEKRGTYYVVSVSGTKFYPQDAGKPSTAVAFEEVPTYQVIRIEVVNDRLLYRAFDPEGKIRDELTIDKSTPAAMGQ